MATGSVSALDRNNWQLIATNTPSSVSSSTFSSISGYDTLMLVNKGLTPSDNGKIGLRFNSDSTTGNYTSSIYYPTTQNSISDNQIIMHNRSDTAVLTYGYVMITNAANTSIPTLTENVNYMSSAPGKGIWFPKDAVTSITIANFAAGTITGTLELYGLA